MSISRFLILLETCLYNNTGGSISMETLRISNPRNQNGGIPQGLDDPLEISNVTFDPDVTVYNYTQDEGRLRDFANVCSFNGTDCMQFLPYSMLESYFIVARRASRTLHKMKYTPQSSDFEPVTYPPECYDANGEVYPEVRRLWIASRISYLDYWVLPSGDPPSFDFFSPCIALAKTLKKPDNPRPPDGPGKSDPPPKTDPVPRLFAPQSGELVAEKIAPNDLHKPLTTFSDDTQDVESQFRSARDDTFYAADTADTDIAKFFQRPILISSTAWKIGTPFTEVILNPAALFFSNRKVVNRIAHHSLLKADLCVKILINGTPFHYGLMMASVYINRADDQMIAPANNLDQYHIGHSQRPHVYLDPTTSQGGCLRFPFINQLNAWDTVAGTVSSSSTLHLREIVTLRHVSGIVENTTVTVVAWAENVVLAAPTQKLPLTIVPQSGDEYGDGVVSRPALILAHSAAIAGKSPYIAPYALPFQMGAKAVGEIARLFGYSKPNIVTDITFMNPRENPPFASAVAHDPIYKATFDDKANVTVDPRVTGADGEDEMTIASIVTRESYLTQFAVTQVNIPGTRVFQIGVGPTLFQTLGTPANLVHHMTPMCWASLPFKHWRGTIRYRFRAVTSSFHRGRIRIVYEPKNTLGTSNTLSDYNVQHTYVWDLAENKEAVIDVGWHSRFPYLNVDDISVAAATKFPFTTTQTVAGNLDLSETSYNGSLSMVVMNELTAPSTSLTADIAIVVMVSALDDFEVFNPTNQVIDKFQYSAQSGELMQDDKFMPVANVAHIIFGKTLHGSKSPMIHHGDSVSSIRALLKRYSHTVTMAINNTFLDLKVIVPAFPLYPGKTPGAVHLAGGVAYNYTSQNAFTWFTPAYVARRGGIRMRFMPLRPDMRNQVVSRGLGNAYTISNVPAPVANANALSKYGFDVRLRNIAGWSGINYSASADKPLDIEVPYYSPLRYSNARALDHLNPTAVVQSVQLSARMGSTAVATTGYDVFVSAADDFSLSIFAAVPIMSRVVTIP